MESNKGGDHHGHHHDHHESKCCGLFNCCSDHKSKAMKIFLGIIIALAIFLIGLSAGSSFGRHFGQKGLYENRFNQENYRGDRRGGCGLRNEQGVPVGINLEDSNVSPLNNPATSASSTNAIPANTNSTPAPIQ